MSPVLIQARNPGPYTGAGNNVYLLPGRVPTLVDAGPRGAAHLADVEAALGGVPLAQVLVTHGHGDHAGAAGAIARRWPGAVFRKLPWPDRDGRDVAWSYLEDDETIAAGDGSLAVVHTPGHSPDHAAFHDARAGLLFTGDLLIRGGTVLIPASEGGSLADYLRSLARIAALAPARALPGHGPIIEDPAALVREYIAHRQQRETQILAALDAGAATVEAIVSHVYGGLTPELHAAAGESVLAHLVKLEAEGRACRRDAEWVGVR